MSITAINLYGDLQLVITVLYVVTTLVTIMNNMQQCNEV